MTSSKLKPKPQSKKYRVGSAVKWPWLGREILGSVVEIYTSTVIKEIKGKNIKRIGSKENPAYLVKSEAGNYALKLGSELSPADSKKVSKNMPTMFGD